MEKHQILAEIRNKYGTVSTFAEHVGTARPVVYQAINGRGSRAARLAVSRLIGISPIKLWGNKMQYLADQQIVNQLDLPIEAD